MTLDEVIQHCEITAKSNEKLAEFYYNKDPGKNQKSGDACQECAAKYRQFAGWLKELKQYREGTLPANDWIPVSERLPEEDKECLVKDINGELGIGYYREDVKAWDHPNWGWLERKSLVDNKEIATEPCGIGKVVAWIPTKLFFGGKKRLKEQSLMPASTEDRLSLKRILEEDPILKQKIGWEDIADEDSSSTPEREICEDAISRQAVLDLCNKKTEYNIPYEYYEGKKHIRGWDEGKIINFTKLMQLPPVTPQPKMGYCKDCKWWRDSDGMYRRGSHAESQCPINRKEVLEGNGYCYMYKPLEVNK